MRLGIILLNKQALFANFEKLQVKGQFGAGAFGFQLVEQFFIINCLRTFSKGTFLINVFYATQQGISCHLAFVKATQRLNLARQARRLGQDRTLS